MKASVANPNRELVLEETRTHFGERFGMAPEVIAIAPGRVNLIGEQHQLELKGSHLFHLQKTFYFDRLPSVFLQV